MFSLFQPNANYTNIQPHEAVKALSSYHVVDVREPYEYQGELGHIEGSELIPLATLPGAIERLRALDKPLLVVCRSGGRSGHGAELLADAGVERVFNLSGGMLQWSALHLPTCTHESQRNLATSWSLAAAGTAPCC